MFIKSKGKRVVIYTCRYSSGNLIPDMIELYGCKNTNFSLYVFVCFFERLISIHPRDAMDCNNNPPKLFEEVWQVWYLSVV